MDSEKTFNENPEESEMTIEEGFAQMDQIIAGLEDPDVGLEDSFRLYEKGMKLLRSVNEKVDRVEKKVQTISEEGELDNFEQA